MFVKDNRLATLLDAVNCKELHLFTEKLNQEETEALVRAMTSRVEIVHLGSKDGLVSLDVDTLTKYKGDGKCKEVQCVWVKVTPNLEKVQVHAGGGAAGDAALAAGRAVRRGGAARRQSRGGGVGGPARWRHRPRRPRGRRRFDRGLRDHARHGGRSI